MVKTLFTHVTRTLRNLIAEVEEGKLGLPELQRPFVWSHAIVRDLLDSMIKGYPIGYLMIWDAPDNPEKSKSIGKSNKTYSIPKSLLIDGQQRLTSLYAVMRGVEVIDGKGNEKRIIISFNPLEGIFKVGDSATEHDADWIYDISDVYRNESLSINYIKKIELSISEASKKQGKVVTDKESARIQQNILNLLSLIDFNIPILEISGKANEESVADIFIRVNSGGMKLNEDDFILTLISLYWPEGRRKIEAFCSESKVPVPKGGTAYNLLFNPSPTHIIRVAMSYGFKRAKLHYALMVLRGKDLDTGKYSEDQRNKQFKNLKEVLNNVLDVGIWKEFIKSVEAAGFVSKELISSENALVYSYVMYLFGKIKYSMQPSSLRKLIGKWFFMTAVSGYYTGSSESRVEQDLNDLSKVKTNDDFVSLLERKMDNIFTDDYFENTLPNKLANSAPRNPAWFGYCAALNVINAKVLFSTLNTRALFNPAASGKKKALERHHLFPKAYLTKIGITEDRERNQLGNFAFIEWSDNIEILDASPAKYMKKKLETIPATEKAGIYADHALPDGWENMDYYDFLEQRRSLMAKVIKKGYKKI